MDCRGRFERVHVGSYIRYVGSHSLCLCFFSRYGDCYRHGVGCRSLYVGYTGAMRAVTVYVRSIPGTMGAVTGAGWDT